MSRFRDREHLVRMAVLFAAGIAVFVVMRVVLVPADFGEYGHYRAGALADNASVVPVYAGRDACADCHEDVVASRQGSLHAQVGCEACHGALGAHAADPGEVQPVLLEATPLCLHCHARSVARPASFPQVDAEEHAGGDPCTDCHLPHHPEIS